jgi:hypothetical protein
MVWSLLALAPARFVQARIYTQYCGDVEDASYEMGTDHCGNTEWDLGVSWGGGVRTPYEYDYAYGTCEGGYYGCADEYVEPGFQQGFENWTFDYPDGDYGFDSHWMMDDWLVSYSSCNNGIQRDEVQELNDYPWSTAEFEVDCV